MKIKYRKYEVPHRSTFSKLIRKYKLDKQREVKHGRG